jgi:hypothetical protein
VLKQELGVAPAAETRALIDEALRRRHNAVSDVGTSLQLSPRASPVLPFAGRDQLLATLQTIGRAVLSGRGATVLLQGEAGIGKTRLVNELADRLAPESPRWLILRGSCSPFDDLLSYGPFLEAFKMLQRRFDRLLTNRVRGCEWTFFQLLQVLRLTAHRSAAAGDRRRRGQTATRSVWLLAISEFAGVVNWHGSNAEAIPAMQGLITLSNATANCLPLSIVAQAASHRAAGLSATSTIPWLPGCTIVRWQPVVIGEILP